MQHVNATRHRGVLLALTLGVGVAWGCATDQEGELRLDERARDRSAPQGTVATVERRALAVGGTHACGIRGDGVICWGDDRFGQLGDGLALGRARAAVVETDVQLRGLAAGYAHTCGLDSAGQAYCWGANARGELGDGTFIDRATPVAVVGSHRFASLTAGPERSCGLTPDGAVYCWGGGRSMPQAVSGLVRFRALATSRCALSTSDELHCRVFTEAEPTPERFRTVAAGYRRVRPGASEWQAANAEPGRGELSDVHMCGLTHDDRVVCWYVQDSYGSQHADSIAGVTGVEGGTRSSTRRTPTRCCTRSLPSLLNWFGTSCSGQVEGSLQPWGTNVVSSR